MLVADDAGRLAASIESLLTREVSTAQLGLAAPQPQHSLLTISWNELSPADTKSTASTTADTLAATNGSAGAPASERAVLIATEHSPLARALREGGVAVELYGGLEGLSAALEQGAELPEHVLYDCDHAHAHAHDPAAPTTTTTPATTTPPAPTTTTTRRTCRSACIKALSVRSPSSRNGSPMSVSAARAWR